MTLTFKRSYYKNQRGLEVIVKGGNNLGFKDVPIFGEIVEDLITRHGNLTLNFLETDFLGSTLLGTLVNIGQKARECGTRLRIKASGELKEAFKVGHLDSILEVI